jgi:hypothetical protein
MPVASRCMYHCNYDIFCLYLNSIWKITKDVPIDSAIGEELKVLPVIEKRIPTSPP